MTFDWRYIILLFFAMSVLGWLIEVACKYAEFGRFINRGFFIGPYCPIYGVGSVLIILLLEEYVSSPVLVFVMAMVVCGVLEYLTSYAMEQLFHARWWDYSHRRLNINGRICAETLIPFGGLGLLLVYIIKPILFRWFDGIPSALLTPLCAGLLILLAVDAAISATVLSKIRKSANLTGGDDTETLTRAVRETLGKQNILFRRAILAFPYARVYNHKLLTQLRAGQKRIAEETRVKKRQLREEVVLHNQKLRAELAEQRKEIRQMKKSQEKGLLSNHYQPAEKENDYEKENPES